MQVRALIGFVLVGVGFAQKKSHTTEETSIPHLQAQLEDFKAKFGALQRRYDGMAQACGQAGPNDASGNGSASDTCGAYPIDLVFVVDSSGSISAIDYQLQKDFLKSIVEMLDFNPTYHNGTIMSVIQFSTWLKTAVYRQDDKATILKGLDDMKQIKGYTRLGLALSYTNRKFMVKGETLREEALPVIVILTDGRSTDGLGKYDELHLKKALIMTIGVGKDIDASQLETIATPGYMHKAIDYSDLGHYKGELTQSICTKKIINVCENQCEDTCTGTVDSTKSQCANSAPLDLVFVIDSSASITQTNKGAYEELRHFLNATMHELDFKGDKTKTVASMVQFSSNFKPTFRYEDDLETITTALTDMTHLRRGTNLKSVLRFLNKYWIKYSEVNKYGVLRKGAKTIVVIITDAVDNGDGTDNRPKAYKEIKKMHELGIMTHAIGVGGVNRDHLTRLATPHPENHYVHLEKSYNDLLDWQQIFTQGLCAVGETQVCTNECTEVCTKKEIETKVEKKAGTFIATGH